MAASEDRLGAYTNNTTALPLRHDLPIANPDTDTFYANTLIQYDASADTATPLSHTAGDDDSGLIVFGNFDHQSAETREAFTGNVLRGRAGQNPLVTVWSGQILELNTNDAISNYDIGTVAYAVDNETVDAAQADGSAGSRAAVGVVYNVRSDEGTVDVYVPGFMKAISNV